MSSIPRDDTPEKRYLNRLNIKIEHYRQRIESEQSLVDFYPSLFCTNILTALLYAKTQFLKEFEIDDD